MSNFLNNLVARTLNLAPVVQPRIHSRFEPLSAAAPAAPDQSVEVETPTQPHVTTTKIIEQHVTDPKPVVVPSQQPRVDFQQVINTIRNTHVESHEVVQVPVIEKIHERTHTETRIHTEKNTDSRLEVRENRIVEPSPKVIRQDPLNPRPEPVPPVTKEATVAAPPQIVPRVVTRVEPAPITPAPRFEIPPAPQIEPTEMINVTIGRVDVRAVFSSQPPKAPVRTSTTNSLNDYLKQRSEGRR